MMPLELERGDAGCSCTSQRWFTTQPPLSAIEREDKEKEEKHSYIIEQKAAVHGRTVPASKAG